MHFKNYRSMLAHTGVLMAVVAVAGSMPAAAYADTYIARTKDITAVAPYLLEISPDELADGKTLEQIPYEMFDEPKAAYVREDTRLNMRIGCSGDEGLICVLEPGEEVTILGTAHNSKWVYVDTVHGKGFVFSKYLTVTGSKETDHKVCLIDLNNDEKRLLLDSQDASLSLTRTKDKTDMLEAMLLQTGKNPEEMVWTRVGKKTMYVNTSAQRWLRIRAGCSAAFEEISALKYGSEVTVDGYGINGEWAHISSGEADGFVYAKYLSADRPQEKAVPVTTDVQAPTDAGGSVEEIAGESAGMTDCVSLGMFKLTFYCNCSTCCGIWAGGRTAGGTYPEAGRTIAVDPSVIPLGSKVMINGHVYTAEDTGSGISGNRIDVYMDSHAAALDAGVQYAEVLLLQ